MESRAQMHCFTSGTQPEVGSVRFPIHGHMAQRTLVIARRAQNPGYPFEGRQVCVLKPITACKGAFAWIIHHPRPEPAMRINRSLRPWIREFRVKAHAGDALA